MVWISFITRQALAQVTYRPIDRPVDAPAISLAYEILPLLSFITGVCVIPNGPIKNHRKPFSVIQLLKIGRGESELALLCHEGEAAGVKLPHMRMIVVATQSHIKIVQSTGDVGLATPNARARVLINAVKVFAYGHAPGKELFFPSMASENCASVTTNGIELVFGIGYGVWRFQREPEYVSMILVSFIK